MQTLDVYIAAATRTPIGAFLGALAELPAPALASQAIAGLLEKTVLTPDALLAAGQGQGIFGCVLPAGVGQAPARQAMRGAALPDSIGALTINKVCGSGLMALVLARQAITLGEADWVLAGGMESMSRVPFLMPASARTGHKFGALSLNDSLIHDGLWDPYYNQHMGAATEVCIAQKNVSREAQDAYAIESYTRARAAITSGVFEEELTPVTLKKGAVSQDEQPFKDDLDKLPTLKTAFVKESGTITAGNASTLNDGAAALLVASGAALERIHLAPMARIVASAVYSQDPQQFSTAPIGAIEAVLARAGLTIAQIDCFEINEAFAAVPLFAMHALDIAHEKVNPRGGAVALGHPIGASGARIMTTLLHTIKQQQLRYGLATLCIGGGEAVAMVVENCALDKGI
ncbi:MAG: thiolase family protein [Vampirovibrionales bacterium]|nr:thiolase family protein [Vampirovibrionales bacterium]